MPTQAAHASFEAIGTHWRIQINEPITKRVWAQLQAQIHDRIETFDKTYSRFRADSLVAQMSKKAGTYRLPDDGYAMLHFYEQLYAATSGKVTPLIGQAMSGAGYDAAYSLQVGTPASPPHWEDVLSYSHHHITVAQPVLLDFGAAGKGYLVDIVSGLIAAAGIRSYVIDAGGDILQRSGSSQALEVGLENPQDTSEAVGIVSLVNQSLCASAGSKRKWAQFHHIIDPSTLQSPQHIAATWVLASDTMTADGLATALFFTDGAQLAKHFAYSYAILAPDMQLHYALGFPVTVFEATA